jgi:hypothetical protein
MSVFISSKIISTISYEEQSSYYDSLEMANKLPNVLAEFKKGNLPEDGLKQMVDLANGLIPQYK